MDHQNGECEAFLSGLSWGSTSTNNESNKYHQRMEETMVHLLMKQHLWWLGRLARMEPSRMPKQLLFGEL